MNIIYLLPSPKVLAPNHHKDHGVHIVREATEVQLCAYIAHSSAVRSIALPRADDGTPSNTAARMKLVASRCPIT